MNNFIFKLFQLIYFLIYIPSYLYFSTFYFGFFETNDLLILLLQSLLTFIHVFIFYYLVFFILKWVGVFDDN